ncbi:universal stress protein [Mucilaginibacter rigui]|uniref:Universal stress protein n=1 Tax=Mucilaginibacter rigui TaxID=534635 RepID=A0ABR7X839_9SPHI|nr:universal stress protein [Mucilaginibacter rigui]MBD1386734.1 universal stress protein [Mucilaginibacter rigui]
MKNQIKNILIPVDLTETSLNALNTGIQMAKRHLAQLHLLYVQDFMDHYPKMGQMVTLEPIMDEVYLKDKVLLEKIVQTVFCTHQVNCSLQITSGNRPIIISDKARELNIDLIIIGTDPNIDKKSYLNDSLPYKVLQHVDCHVLTVPASKEVNRFERIIFPVTSQENPVEKLKLSQSFIAGNNARVSIIGLVKTQDLTFLSTIRNVSDQIKRRVSRFAESVTRKSVYTLNPAKDLKKICEDEDAQLIIVQGNTNRNLKQFFFGNFTQRMIRNAEVAVLFINNLSGTDRHRNLVTQTHVIKLLRHQGV